MKTKFIFVLLLLLCFGQIFGQISEGMYQPYPQENMLAFGGFEGQQFFKSEKLGTCLIRITKADSYVNPENWESSIREFIPNNTLLIMTEVKDNQLLMESLNKTDLSKIEEFPNKDQIIYCCGRILSSGYIDEPDSILVFNIYTNTGIRMLAFMYSHLDIETADISEDWLFFKY